MRHLARLAGLLWLLMAVLTPTAWAERPVNLLRNAGAESGPAGATNHERFPPTRWRTSGGFTVVRYRAPFVTTSFARSIGGGRNFFGGSGTQRATARQTVRLSRRVERRVVHGRARGRLSAYIGGFAAEPDPATVEASLLNRDGRELRRVVLGPVTPDERGRQTVMVPLARRFEIPRGTRSVAVTMTARRVVLDCNDGYFDNLYLGIR